MIPLRDVIPSRTTPAIVYAIMVANVLVFFWEWTLPAPHLAAVIPASRRKEWAQHGLVGRGEPVGGVAGLMPERIGQRKEK